MPMPKWTELRQKKWFPFVLIGLIVAALGWTLYVTRPTPQSVVETPAFRLAVKIREQLQADPRFRNIECIMPMGEEKIVKLSGEVESEEDAEALEALAKTIPAGEFTIEVHAEAPPGE